MDPQELIVSSLVGGTLVTIGLGGHVKDAAARTRKKLDEKKAKSQAKGKESK